MRMPTWKEYMKHGGPSGWDGFDNYIGGHEMEDWLVFLGRNRDSGNQTNSNFETALEMIGGESDTVELHSFNHWLVGWIELILIDPTDSWRWWTSERSGGSVWASGTVEECEGILDSLEDYPLLDEEDYSKREWEEWEESYNWNVQGSLERGIESREEEAETQFFLNEEGDIELTEEERELLFRVATDNAGCYGYEHVEEEEVIDNFLTQAIPAFIPTHPDLFEEEETLMIDEELKGQLDALGVYLGG